MFSPNINNENDKANFSDGIVIRNLQVAIYFINRGLNPLFHHPVLLLILNYHNSESNSAQRTKVEVPHQSYFFDLGEF